jgi:type I site-specific restriction endonuclease
MKNAHLSNEMLVQRIAENINARREARACTITSLEQTSAISRRTLQNFLSEHKDIKLSTLLTLLKSLDSLDILNPLVDPYTAYSPVKQIKQLRMHTIKTTTHSSDTSIDKRIEELEKLTGKRYAPIEEMTSIPKSETNEDNFASKKNVLFGTNKKG